MTTWQTLLTLDRESDNFTQFAIRLLGDERNRKFEVSRLSEAEALELIELMESTVRPSPCPETGMVQLSEVNPSQILQHPSIPGDLKSTAFTILRRLCGTFGKLPTSCLINEDFKTHEEFPFATRGYSDLWKRDWNGRKVAVKSLRFAPDDDKDKMIKVNSLLVGRSRGSHSKLTFTYRGFAKRWFCGSA